MQHDLKWFAPGITTRFVSRQDSDASVYANKVSGQEVSKRRQDYELAIRPNLTVPLFPYTQLVVWYEWDRIYSNMTSVDYLDRGYLNQSVGFSLRAALSNY